MALILETGEGAADSESFVGLAFVRAFASSRGKTVSSNDNTLEQQIRIAHDYILVRESLFQGQRTTDGQALPFPRTRVTLFNKEVPKDAIPLTLKNAVCQLVIDSAGVDALPIGDGRVIIQESVGPLSTTYQNTGAAVANPVFQRVEIFLAPLYAFGRTLSTLRI